MTAINYRTADVDGSKIFYREAVAAGAPKLLLLHGFPTAGHMFRDLIPLLSDRFTSSLRTCRLRQLRRSRPRSYLQTG